MSMITAISGQRQRARLPLSGSFLTLIIALQLFTQPTRAQQVASKEPLPPAAASTSSSTPAPLKLGAVTVSGSLRARVENWQWFETPAADADYTFGAATLRLSFSQQREKFDWQVEGAFPLLVKLPENAIAPAPQGQLGLGGTYFAANGGQDAGAFVKQAFVRFKNLGGRQGSSLRVGRFEFADGAEMTPADATLATLKRDHIAQRLIGAFGFTHVGRSFDGVHFNHSAKDTNFTLLAARPTEGVFQLRGWQQLDVDFYYGAFTKAFADRTLKSEARVFALHYHDGRGALKTDNRALVARQADGDNIRLTTLGGHYLGAAKAGSGAVDLLVWGAGQFGSWGRLTHRAAALAAEAGYQFKARGKPWVRAGYFRSTGDGDATDGRHTTFFQALPTPRPFARFPFYNLMNNDDLFAQLRVKPHARLTLRGDARRLRLSQENDLWYLGGGAFQKHTFGYVGRPSSGQKSLGTLFDLSVDYNLAARTALSFYIGGVRGGGVQRALYPAGGAHPTGRFAYVEWTQRF